MYFVILLFLSMLVGFAYAYEPVPAGIEVIEYGIFDKDGNVVHQLRADQPYQINVHFESELEVSVSFTYHVQILDKNKHWTEPVEEFNASGILQPNEEKTISFEWIPKYDGKFRTLVGFGNNEDDTAIGSVPQYDFEVASEIKPPLKQTQSGIPFDEIQCKENLVLIQKYDGSSVCVKPETVSKLVAREWGISDNWIKISNVNKAINYQIDNAKITSIQAFSEHKNPSLQEEIKQTWLKINLESKQDGSLKITLPRNLIDSKIGHTDDGFFVLLDDTETEYQETETESERILNFSIPAKTDIIEIIGYDYYNPELNQFHEPKPMSEDELIPTIKIFKGEIVSPKTIKFNGWTNQSNQEIALIVTAPNGNIISTGKLSPMNNGTFVDAITTGGSLWEQQDGIYLVTVQQGNDPKNSVYFQLELKDGNIILRK